MSFIDRIKEKPQRVKGRYAFIGAIVVTSVIGMIWATSLPARFDEFVGSSASIAEEEITSPDPIDELSKIWDDTRGQRGNVIDAEEINDAEDALDANEGVENETSTGTLPVKSAEDVGSGEPHATSTMRDESATTTQPEDTDVSLDVEIPQAVPATSTPEVPEISEPRVVLIATTSSKTNVQESE